MRQLRDRLRTTDSPMLSLQMNDHRAGVAFPSAVSADPNLAPATHSTRRLIREVLKTPAAQSAEGQRILGGCLSLYNGAKFGAPPLCEGNASVGESG
jgi:hypothetical protein